MDIAGKNAIITGGSSGIGKAVGCLLVERGLNVAIIARTQETLNGARNDLERCRRRVDQRILKISADVSIRNDCFEAIETAKEQMGGVDLLITSAGMARPGYFKELPIEVFEETMRVNYFGSLYAVKAVLPTMERQARGHVVLVSSGAGLTGIFGYTPYSPTKFALRGFAEALRSELKPVGIQVSIVYPPDTDTPQLHEENKTKPKERKAITGTAKCWSADNVAEVILKGIKKKKFAITPGVEMTSLNLFNSILARPIYRYFDSVIRKVQKSKPG